MNLRTFLIFGLAVIVCLFTGCFESTNPLSDPADRPLDKRLIGLWQYQHEGGVAYYHVGSLGRNAPKGVMQFVMVGRSRDGDIEKISQAVAFPTEIGAYAYLNLAEADPEQIAKIQKEGWIPGLLDSYVILKYRVEEDAVLVWPMGSNAAKKAIEAGTVKGSIKEREGVVIRLTEVRFTDTSENLVKLVSTTDDLFLDKPVRFERVR